MPRGSESPLLNTFTAQVGPKELHEHHEELKTIKTSHSQSCDLLKKKKKDLEEEKRANSLLQRDVERFQNREKLEKEIKLLIYKKHWMVSLNSIDRSARKEEGLLKCWMVGTLHF